MATPTSSSRQPHLAIACGGTGGHVYPALAAGAAFRDLGGRVTVLLAGHHVGQHLKLADEYGFAAAVVPAPRLGGGPAGAALFPFRLARGWWCARQALKRAAPGALLGMGSFASVPAGLAAWSLGLPLLLHEGNSRAGRANRLLARRARWLATSLPLEEAGWHPPCPLLDSGLPLRPALLQAAAAPASAAGYLAELGLRPDRPTLLLFGGSQGARFLNELLPKAVARLPAGAPRPQLLHFTGQADNAALVAEYARLGIPAAVKPGETHMAGAYAAAGLVVCRAGASTITELALFGKPAVLIPLPTAADDHQTANARMVAARGAGRHLPQADATPECLAAAIAGWLDQPASVRPWGEAVRSLARPQAAQTLAAALWKLLAD